MQYCCCMGHRPVCSIPVWPHTCHPCPQGQFSFSAMCARLCLMQHGVGFAPQVGRVSTPTWDSKSDQGIGGPALSPRVQLDWSGSSSCHDRRCCRVQLFLRSPWGKGLLLLGATSVACCSTCCKAWGMLLLQCRICLRYFARMQHCGWHADPASVHSRTYAHRCCSEQTPDCHVVQTANSTCYCPSGCAEAGMGQHGNRVDGNTWYR